MSTLANNRSLRPACILGIGLLVAVVLSVAARADAAEKEMLKEHFRPLYERFGQTTQGKVTILSGPEAVMMRRGGAPGKQ